MKTLVKNKVTLGAIAIFILAIFSYNVFLNPTADLSVPGESSASSIGDDLVKLHGELQAVTLNREIFSSPSYLLLTDFSTDIPQQEVGRPNPFNAIGQD